MSASLRADMVSENTNLGLSKKYKDPESDIGKWLKTFFGLSYLDSSDVADCFAFDILLDAPDDEKAMEFVDCILNTYVDDKFQNLNASKSKSYRYQCRKYCSLEV
jgi:succinate dehydrogenase flavin-adding protein (antitoxin of CptAB toxin-antitoxin module)